MCDTCGCGIPGEKARLIRAEDLDKPLKLDKVDVKDLHNHGHLHVHDHDHVHAGSTHTPRAGREIAVELDIMQRNNLAAAANRNYFQSKGILALNLVSSPGSGKTSLLERTIRSMPSGLKCSVIEGDQQTNNDARRIRDAGAPVIQINTGNGCHLEADVVGKAIQELAPGEGSVLFVENVGNLVCPALFDLGEEVRVVVISVTEGEDKPLKYPNMFRSSGLCIINKTDLLPYLDFDVSKAREYARQVNPDLEFIELSVRTGEGFSSWLDWLERKMKH
ncbi:MAG: hydrogenase nickel incorporation protein HypB [Bacteroidales bacterium]